MQRLGISQDRIAERLVLPQKDNIESFSQNAGIGKSAEWRFRKKASPLPGQVSSLAGQSQWYGHWLSITKKTLILGEAKTSISRREISRFQKIVKRAAQLENITSNDICQVVVVHDVTPNIEEYAKKQGIQLYWSYDL